MAEGGSAAIARALASYLASLGGRIETGRRVRSLADLPPARVYLFDTSPAQLADIAGPVLPARYVRRLRRYRYGPGVFKIDWALDGPIPWKDPQLPGGVDGPRGRDARGDRRRRGGGVARRAPRAAVRARRAAEPVRPEPRARRQAHRLRLLPRPGRLDGRPDRGHRAPDRALRARLPRPHPRAPRDAHGRLRAPTTRTTSAAPSPAASPTCSSSSRGRWRGSTRTRRRIRASSSARPRRRRAAACTGCAGSTRRGAPCGGWSASRWRR